jgi:UDP-galactopyranose mutase
MSLPILLCLSHLRWDFVFQRPQHLMTRAVAGYQVVFFEEAVPASGPASLPTLELRRSPEGVLVATPMLPEGLDAIASDVAQRELLDGLLAELAAPLAVAWFYTPMALAFAGHLRPAVAVYDCMDELNLFRGASPRLALLERRLLKQADLVFTGGRSLYEAKHRLHPHAHLFPSSVDAAHFRVARFRDAVEPPDQAGLPPPRIGFFGVLDERINYALLDSVAAARRAWQIVMVGPTAKIDPAALPRSPNLHWLGMKAYAELPAYLAGWDAGLMPFALNEATRFISPTKTPEFLAAGVPVVSTPVPDVVADWGTGGLVEIADGPDAVVAAIEAVLARPRQPWLSRVDQRLAWLSWNATWVRMLALIEDAAGGAAPAQEATARPPAN